MKYKNNRKELDERLRFITARVGSTSENEIIKNLAILSDDFLAQKEDRKDEQPCNNFKPASNNEGYETTKYPHQCPICKGWRGFCLNCNKDHHENGWDSCNPTPSPEKECKCSCHQLNPVAFACTECQKNHPTPSPLEIEEIEEISDGDMRCLEDTRLIDKLWEKQCQIIRNQKKLYQYIKEKKI